MRIKIKFFASYKEAVGKYEEELELVPSSTVRDVINKIVKKHPNIELDKGAILVLNQEIIKGDPKVKEGDVMAIFPPLGGG